MSLTLAEGVDSVVLPNPTFGDADTVDFNNALSRNRSGEPLISRDTDWPINNETQYEFIRLISSKKDELEAFLIAKAGLEITLTDHEGTVKTGIILDSEIEMVTMRDSCSYDAAFRFVEDIS